MSKIGRIPDVLPPTVDDFAIAALTGLVARHTGEPLPTICKRAYEWAELMVKVRNDRSL